MCRYDGLVCVPGCDKNMPGCVMGMARVNRPSIMVYGGTIKPGYSPQRPGETLDVVSAFQCYGQYLSGRYSHTLLTNELLSLVTCNHCRNGVEYGLALAKTR